MLDSNDTVFKCNTSTLRKLSRITADFELKNVYEVLTFYLFTDKRSYSDKQFCKSFINSEKQCKFTTMSLTYSRLSDIIYIYMQEGKLWQYA